MFNFDNFKIDDGARANRNDDIYRTGSSTMVDEGDEGGIGAAPSLQPPQMGVANETSNVLGVIMPGRPVLFKWSQIDATKLTAMVPNPGGVSEMSFFLLPGATLPPGQGAVLYYSVPPFQLWSLLGAVTTEVPSVFFTTGWESHPDVKDQSVAQLGVALEPLDTISNLEQAKILSLSKDRTHWARHLAQDLHKYVSSFSHASGNGGEEEITFKTSMLDKWLHRVNGKYQRDPNFVFKQ